MKKIIVTGGCGYKGTVLVPKLLNLGHSVTVVDTLWFGNHLADHENLEVCKSDIRDVESLDLTGVDTIIHLASVANDPCGDLDPKLTWEIGALATMQLADAAVRAGVSQFIYSSSGSVYGVKEEERVTEELTLKPISEYNKTKMVAERVLLSYSDQITVQIVRPATVCGLSPRMRLDVSVNMLTMQALMNGVITVFGGKQVRPNIHIQDITDLYVYLLNQESQITGVYNAGFENLSILEIATMVSERISAEIRITESNDPRSYRLDSSKLLATGFAPQYTVSDAIDEIIADYKAGNLNNDEKSYNMKWMQRSMDSILGASE